LTHEALVGRNWPLAMSDGALSEIDTIQAIGNSAYRTMTAPPIHQVTF
jgi:hypothetical protein